MGADADVVSAAEESAFTSLLAKVADGMIQEDRITHIPGPFAAATETWSDEHWRAARTDSPLEFEPKFIAALWMCFAAGREYERNPFPIRPCDCGQDHADWESVDDTPIGDDSTTLMD